MLRIWSYVVSSFLSLSLFSICWCTENNRCSVLTFKTVVTWLWIRCSDQLSKSVFAWVYLFLACTKNNTYCICYRGEIQTAECGHLKLNWECSSRRTPLTSLTPLNPLLTLHISLFSVSSDWGCPSGACLFVWCPAAACGARRRR